ncbi:MAG: NADH-quinone oxidoreductase subunit NuoF [Candidatus Tectomicrobia bacterium]|nr:NADH-quinone oxidoreductase subunit NuoF [Candidatus Tectomicrobia bacterium]
MEPIITRHIGTPDLWRLDTYRANGGYETLARALRERQPDDLVTMVRDAGLRGRGGAGFPTGVKWGFLPKDGRPRYLICNGDESEPGTFKDRLLLENDPHQVLEGLILSCYAVGAHLAFIYLRGEFFLGAQRVQAAIDEAYAAGYLGRNILGSDMHLEVLLHRGAGAYICGEETGLIESLEGKRAYPRIKPPFPANIGAFGMPTVVNNVETLANVRHIAAHGADWYNAIGPERNRGTRMWCVSGRVQRPGVYEVPLGIPLRELIFDHAGGLEEGRTLKAVIPGGSSSPILTAEEAMEVNSDFDALQRAGTMGGSGGLMVLDDRVCVVQSSYIISEFYHDESCGQCTPCRQGTGWMTKLLHRIEHGEGRPGDVDLLLSMGANIFGRTICPLGDAAVWPVESAINKFRSEFDHHISEKRCLPGTESIL